MPLSIKNPVSVSVCLSTVRTVTVHCQEERVWTDWCAESSEEDEQEAEATADDDAKGA